MDDKQCYQDGMVVWCKVLGDVYVDCMLQYLMLLNDEFQDFIICYVWGEIWMCLGFDYYICSMIIIVMLIVFNCEVELKMYLCVLFNNGVICDELKELIMYFVLYCGLLVVNVMMYLVQQVFDDIDVVQG